LIDGVLLLSTNTRMRCYGCVAKNQRPSVIGFHQQSAATMQKKKMKKEGMVKEEAQEEDNATSITLFKDVDGCKDAV
jgi:hypothetical protein